MEVGGHWPLKKTTDHAEPTKKVKAKKIFFIHMLCNLHCNEDDVTITHVALLNFNTTQGLNQTRVLPCQNVPY